MGIVLPHGVHFLKKYCLVSSYGGKGLKDFLHCKPYSEAIVYPNPGSTQLTIETALKDLQFELYNANGQTVVSQPVNNGTTTVNTSALPAGVYLYRFMNKDKIVESGKWVKE